MKEQIVKITLNKVFVPFREEVKGHMSQSSNGLGMALSAEEAWLGGDFVVCQLETRSGYVGFSEAFVWLPETGVSPDQLIDTIKQNLAKYVLGESPFQVASIRNRMERNISRNEVAKGLIDSACYDLQARILNVRVVDLLGGAQREHIPLAALLPLMENVDSIVGLAMAFKDMGHRSFRFKLGENLAKDEAIIKSARAALGDEVKIRVDYNQAYSVADAVKSIDRISRYDIEIVEQPCKADHYTGMGEVQQRVSVPNIAHEGCFSLQDIYHLGEMGAIEAVGINAERPGGISNAVRAIHYAEQKGMGVVMHNQPLGLGSAWQVHVGAAFYSSLHYEMELFGQVMMEHDLLTRPLDYRDGGVAVPTGIGFGVEIDPYALKEYGTAPSVVIHANS